jgi:hypothetical protein
MDHDEYDPALCVKAGAALLDLKVPDWAEKLNEAMLDGVFSMTEWDCCVAGSLELVRYFDGTENAPLRDFLQRQGLEDGEIYLSFNGMKLCSIEDMAKFGFTIPPDRAFGWSESAEYFDVLQDNWEIEVQRRVFTGRDENLEPGE